jgi:hypothetical protein
MLCQIRNADGVFASLQLCSSDADINRYYFAKILLHLRVNVQYINKQYGYYDKY